MQGNDYIPYILLDTSMEVLHLADGTFSHF